MRIVFAGTSEIAVPTLQALAENFEVAGVLTAASKPEGRSRRLADPPVKTAADALGLPVIQCEHVNRPEREAVCALGADFLLSFSFGRIFGPKFLSLFDRTMNIHPSVLPKSRGPAPVQQAILSGEREWGISFQEIGLEMDCGRLYDVLKFNLTGKEDTVSLTQTIASLAAARCPEVLRRIEAGTAVPVGQSGEPSYCRLIGKDDGLIDFNRSALAVHALIRAMYDWPKASTTLDGSPILITGVWGGFEELDSSGDCAGTPPGTIVAVEKGKGLKVACSDRFIHISRVQLPTRKEISWQDLANQKKNLVGMRFGL